MDTTTDDLIKLREHILEQTMPLLNTDDIPADERFRLMLQLAQSKGTTEVYKKAFEIAEKLEGDAKLDAYLELMASIDATVEENLDADADTSDDNGNG